jgi:hypothetical protein
MSLEKSRPAPVSPTILELIKTPFTARLNFRRVGDHFPQENQVLINFEVLVSYTIITINTKSVQERSIYSLVNFHSFYRKSEFKYRLIMVWHVFLYQMVIILWSVSFLTLFCLQMTSLWDTAQCSVIEVDRRFGSSYCLRYHGDLITAGRTWNLSFFLSSMSFPCSIPK